MREEIEKERNKSLADEATIRKLENLLREKEKELLEDNRIKMKNDNDNGSDNGRKESKK